MIKLQDFANDCKVTDRQIQRLLKKYASELEGTFERRGPNGTWLSEECQKFLRSKMKVKEIVLIENGLADKVKELEARIERKDVLIEKLQQRVEDSSATIELMKSEKLAIEEKHNSAIKTAEQLQKQLDDERIRPLTLMERLTGRKKEK